MSSIFLIPEIYNLIYDFILGNKDYWRKIYSNCIKDINNIHKININIVSTKNYIKYKKEINLIKYTSLHELNNLNKMTIHIQYNSINIYIELLKNLNINIPKLDADYNNNKVKNLFKKININSGISGPSYINDLSFYNTNTFIINSYIQYKYIHL